MEDLICSKNNINALDQLPVFIWEADSNGVHTYFNQYWSEFTARPIKSLLGDGCFDVIHPNDVIDVKKTFMDAVLKRKIIAVKYRIRHHSGQYFWLQGEGRPIYHDDKFLGYIGFCTDITNLVKLQNDLFERSVELEKSTKLILNREYKMVELKTEIEALKAKLKNTKDES